MTKHEFLDDICRFMGCGAVGHPSIDDGAADPDPDGGNEDEPAVVEQNAPGV